MLGVEKKTDLKGLKESQRIGATGQFSEIKAGRKARRKIRAEPLLLVPLFFFSVEINP